MDLGWLENNYYSVGGVAAITFLAVYLFGKKKNLPPGPSPLPIVGNLLQLSKYKVFTQALHEYQRKYGNIFMLYMGSDPMVVICGHKNIRDAFVTNADLFSERPKFLIAPAIIFKEKGIIWDHNWKSNRKSTLVTLRDFGFGKKSLEDRVYEEAESFCKLLSTFDGKNATFKTIAAKPFSNVICTIVFGQRFEYEDPKFTHLMQLLDYAFSNAGNKAAIINHLPFLKLIPNYRKQFETLKNSFVDIRKYINEIIKEHEQTYDSENLRDFIDLYLHSDKENLETMINIIIELFSAGSETSGTTLTWACLLLAKHPEIQRRCRQEIRQVIGTSRMPKLTDKGSLPYTEATIQEVQRFCTIVPISLPHSVSENVNFGGYEIPKNSIVVPFLDSCHHDPELYPDHDKFRPERWLDASGKFDPKNQAFMPFSVGRRSCLGEQLAKMELFIMLTSVFQQFNFSPIPGKEISLEGQLGVTYCAVHSELLIEKKDP